MQLKQVPTVESIDPEAFRKEFYEPCLPVVIKNLSKDWPAYTKWNWDYFKQLVGDKRVPLYNNVKSDAYTPINTADDYKSFGEYIDMISQGPAAWRIFLFNIFNMQLLHSFLIFILSLLIPGTHKVFPGPAISACEEVATWSFYTR